MFSGQNPFQRSNRPAPNYAEWKKKAQKFIKRAGVPLLILTAALIFLLSGLYTVRNGEEAVITRFGRYQQTVQSPGLHLKIPFIDRAELVNVEGIRRLEFGYRSGEQTFLNSNVSEAQEVVEAESLMLTGDEDLVNADWAILFRVKNSYDWLFRVDQPEGTLRVAAESAYRRVVASRPLDDVLTDKKDDIQREILADLQEICDKYLLGVQITGVQLQDAMPPDPVRDAFLDVSAALEEKQSKINEADKYANEQLPVARGEAAQLINEAEGYKQKRINEALGAVARYQAIEREYSRQKEIMRVRLYLEMIQDVLPKVEHIYFVNEKGDTVQFLPLNPSAVISSP